MAQNQTNISGQQSKSNAQLRKECVASGGEWDEASARCIMPNEPSILPPKPDPIQEPVTSEPKPELSVIKSGEDGRLSGFTRDGKTFLGLKPSEVRQEIEAEAGKRDLEVGGQGEAVLERQRQELQNEGAGLATSVGATPSDDIMQQLQSQITAGEVNYVGALASAVPGIIPDLLSGAVAGGGAVFGIGAATTAATGGAAAPVAAGTVVGAAVVVGVVNAIKGVYTDFVSDVARQKRELIETPIRSLSETKPTMAEIINAQNSNPENAVSNKEQFDNQLAFVDLEYERLKDLADDGINVFLGDTGINQIQEYEVFYIPNGERDRLIEDMTLALANPDPARIRPTSLTIDEIKKRIAESN